MATWALALCAYEVPAAGLGLASGIVGMSHERVSVRLGAVLVGFIAWQAWLPLLVWYGLVRDTPL